MRGSVDRSGGDLPVVFMFAGQGCQYFHMGRELYAEDPRFRRWMRELDARARTRIGESVLEHVHDDRRRKSEPFTSLRITHQAIFMIEYALAQLLRDDGIEPSIVLGASLGEVTAAAVAGVLSVDECIDLLADHARILDGASGRGGMIAVLHDPALYDQAPELHRECELAGVSFDSHFVVSGSSAGVEGALAYLRRRGIPHQRLPVELAFHSSFLDAFRAPLEASVAGLRYRPPAIPFASCAAGTLVGSIDAAHYWQVFRGPMRFHDLVRSLEAAGPHAYVDVGPSGTLSTFAGQILSAGRGPITSPITGPITGPITSSITCPTLTPFGQDLKSLARARAALGQGRTT